MDQAVAEFRQALGRFATGVAIGSLMDAAGSPAGLTISSFKFGFDSAAAGPVQPCAFRTPSGVLSKAKAYAINVLAEEQESLSSRFAKSNHDKWRGVEYARGRPGAPLIPGVLAHVECQPYAQYDGGDHVIVFDQVVYLEQSEQDKPLVFIGGHYRSLHDGQHNNGLLP